jgi:hypothetical protein
MTEDPKQFLRQFPADHQGAIGNMFYEVARAARREWGVLAQRNVGKVCSAMFRSLKEAALNEDSGMKVRKSAVVRAMAHDPEGAKGFMSWVLAQLERPPEEREAEREEKAAQGKREWMEKQTPTQKQLDLLLRLGVDEYPDNRWRASELIEERKDW